MATSAALTMNSATAYQTVFNRTNGIWAGSEKIIPVALPDGRNLWISGLCWSGLLNTGGASRSGSSIHNIFNIFIIENNSSLTILNPSFNDTTNNRLFSIDSFPITGKNFSRLDPVSALVKNQSLYISCRSSTTDFSDWTLPFGPMTLIEIDLSNSSKNIFCLKSVVSLPYFVIPGGWSVYYGSGLLDISDNYLYVVGQQSIPSTTVYDHYLARIPWIYIKNPNKWEYRQTNKWGKLLNPFTDMLSILSTGSQEISLWKEKNNYYILGLYNGNINLYSSTILPSQFTLSAQVGVESGRPSGGFSQGAYIVHHARLASGKRLGFYSNGLANDTYDLANPLYKRPTFFEF